MELPTPEEIRTTFTLHYQPIVDLNTGGVAGFEALTRIIDADGSAQSVGDRIALIEGDPDALYALIQHILGTIGRDLVPLFEKHTGFYVSVNIPPVVLGSGRLKTMIEGLQLMPYARRLVAEVTERQALTDVGRRALELARRNGIKIAVDDFGTGHSGIEQIAGLDFDMLKIDHSLIAPVLTSRIAGRMLRGIVALASALRMLTVAEGVETWEQAFFMRAAGVDYGQGWYWSKALPAKALESVLATGFPQGFRPVDR